MLPYKNSPSSKAIPILLFSILALQSLQHQCIHDHLESDIKINSPSYAIYPHTPGRFLQEYQNISILIDSSNLDNVTDDFKDYILNSIMPAVTNYIQAALRVPTRSSNIKAGGYSALCSGDVKIPSKYNRDGVDYDLVMFVKAKNDSKASYVAAASTCLLDTTTRRPIMGRMTYNLAKVSATTNDAQREKDIVTTLHEMTHALGFSNSLYPYYVDSKTGQDLKGHIKSQTVMGFPTTILNLEPLTTRLKAHFNCSSLAGAYLENQGGTGSAGSHFERRIFYNEYMTASSVVDARITEFTLALLEGTGWYQINYDMAESITWGKNKGCEFVTGPCVNKTTKKANFEEFCSPIIAKSCSWTKRSGSSCGAFRAMKNSSLPSAIDWWGNNTISQDIFSDNCPIQLGYNNLDCEDPDNEGGATLKAETYGYGSRCFMGTLYPKGGLASPYPYCFKSQCKQGTNGDYYLEVRVGSVTVNCTSERQRKVSGYAGALYCPDPQKFCNQVISEGTCRRKCTGRGTCVQNECVCNDGWGGFDCSKRIIVDQCSACANGDPLKTSCFGDQCACNPSNITCMCALGLQKGSLCAGLTTKTINATLTLKEANIDSQAISINSINQTIAERASTFNGERDIANKGETINSETDKEVNILPILLGIVGFLLIAIALFFIVRYARRKLRMMKHTTGTSTKRTRPPKIQISTKSPVMMTDISNPNSPDLLKRGLSLTSHNESPLMKCSSPFREAYTPSRFKDYAMNAQAVIRENEEFCLKIHPISFENQIENAEDKHQEDEKCTPVSFSLPELGQSVPQKTNVHRTSIQYF